MYTASDSRLNPEFLLQQIDFSDLNRKICILNGTIFYIGIQVGARKGHP